MAQKDLVNWRQGLAESKARRLELQKTAKATLHSSTRTKEKINEHEKKQCDARMPSPLSDYECSLDKSYKASLKAKRAGKDVAQLEQQSKQSIDLLAVEDD